MWIILGGICINAENQNQNRQLLIPAIPVQIKAPKIRQKHAAQYVLILIISTYISASLFPVQVSCPLGRHFWAQLKRNVSPTKAEKVGVGVK